MIFADENARRQLLEKGVVYKLLPYVFKTAFFGVWHKVTKL